MTEQPEPRLIDYHCPDQEPHGPHEWRGFAGGSGCHCNGTPAPFEPEIESYDQPEPRLTKNQRITLLEDDVDRLITRLKIAEGKVDARAHTSDLAAVRNRLTAIEAWQAGVDEWVGAESPIALKRRVDELDRLTLRQSQAIVDLENALGQLQPCPEIEATPMAEVQIDVGYTPAANALQRYAEALRMIAGEHCTNSTGDWSCIRDENRSAFSKYGAYNWCDACIAWAALHNEPLR